MPKRIALFIIGFVLAIGAFLLYQHLSGAAYQVKQRVLPPTTRNADSGDDLLTYEERSEEGVLQYLISAEKAEQVKDDQGRPLAGRLRLKNPVATFYDRDGRAMEIRGDECSVVMDPPSKGAAGPGTSGLLAGAGLSAGKTGKGGVPVRIGELSGHVRLVIGPKPAAAPAADGGAGGQDPLPGGLKVYFDEPLRFDRDQATLSSAGSVYVRSRLANFDGQAFTLVVNKDVPRIEYLRIEPKNDKGNKIIVANVGDEALKFTDAPAKGAGGGKGVPATAYKLSFGQNVLAAVGPADARRSLASDRLYLVFMAGSDTVGVAGGQGQGDKPAAAATRNEPAATAPADKAADTGPGPLPAEGPKDLVITWSGPMEMRPTDPAAADANLPALASASDVVLQAVGTAAKPVEVRDPTRFITRAGTLLFHRDTRIVDLLPGELGRVELTNPAGDQVVCAGVRINQGDADATAKLMGPGTVHTKSQDTTIAWNERMDLDLVKAPDEKRPGQTTLAIRRATIRGAGVRSDAVDMTSDVIEAFLVGTADPKQSVALERLVATGKVVVKSLRRDGAKVAASADPDGLKAERLEVLTALPAGGEPGKAAPVPTQLLADGNVTAWRLTSRGLSDAEKKAGALRKEMVTTPHLVADLKVKPKSPASARGGAAVAAGSAAAEAGGDSTFAGLGLNVDVGHFLAKGGARVDIIPPAAADGAASKSLAIVAEAETLDVDRVLEGDAEGAVATLRAAEKPDAAVRITVGPDNSIRGKTIVLTDAKGKQSFEVPGAGEFLFVERKKGKEPVPVSVRWDKRLVYDNTTKLAVFTGNPVAQIAGENPDLGSLKAATELRVKLKDAGGKADDAVGLLAGGNGTGGGPQLDYIEAIGDVDATGSQVDAQKQLVAQMKLNTRDRLIYHGDTESFEVPGPGSMYVNNLRPDKADDRVSKAGVYGIQWAGALVQDPATKVVTVTKGVEFVFKPVKPFKLSAGAGGGQAYAADRANLSTDRLVATFTKAADGGKAVADPIGLGTGGKMDLTRVVADNGAHLKVGAFELHGRALEFDVPANMATVEGADAENPATAIQPGQGIFSATRIVWDMTKDHNAFSAPGIRGNIFGNR